MLQKTKFILSIFIITICNSTFSQEVSLSVKQRPLAEVLQNISTNYNIKIAYDSDLAQQIVVSVAIVQKSPYEAVVQVLKTTNLEAIAVGDVIVVRPKHENTESPEPSLPKEYKILGLVKAKGSSEQLPYATISIDGTNSGTATNSDGFFALSTQKTDSLKIKISYIGFNPTEVTFLPSTQSKILNIEMERQAIEIEDVHIRVKQPDLISSETTPGLLSWNSNRNTDIPSLNGLDISAPLQLLPGIDGTTENSSGLLVRKSLADKNLISYDGFTIYHIDHFFGAFSSLNAKAIKDIRIYKGGFDARWGGRTASVIEITGKTGNANQTVIDAGMDLLNLDATVEGPIGKKFTYVVSARRSYTDVFRSGLYYSLMESARSDIAVLNKTTPSFFKADIDEPVYKYSDISLKLSFKPNEKSITSLSAYLGNDNLNLEKSEVNTTLNEGSTWTNGGIGLRWSRQWSQTFNQSITLGASHYRLGFEHSDSTVRKRQNSNIRDTILRDYGTNNSLNDINLNFSNSIKLNSKSEMQFGIQANGVGIIFSDNASHYINRIEIIDTTRTENQKMLLSTVWGQYNFNSEKLSMLTFGIRASKYSPSNYLYLEPRVQFAYKVSQNISFKGSAGRYYQFVNRVLQFSQYNLKNVWYIANGSNYPVVSSTHIVAGGAARFWGLVLDAEAYHKRTNGLSVFQVVVKRGQGQGIRQEQKIIGYNNKSYGLDIMLRKEFPFTHMWISYSLSRSSNQSDYFNWGVPYPAYDDQLHEVKLATVGKWQNWGYNLVWIYGSGKPWDEPLFTQNLTLSPYYSKNSNQLPSYHRLDAGLNYSIKSSKLTTKIGINLLNVYNNKNLLAILHNLADTPVQTYLQTGTPLEYSNFYGLGFNWLVYLNIKF